MTSLKLASELTCILPIFLYGSELPREMYSRLMMLSWKVLLWQLETVTSVLVICSDEQFSFQITTERGCKMAAAYRCWKRVPGGRSCHGEAVRTVSKRPCARWPRAAERRWRRPAFDQWCLWKLLGIKWYHHMWNDEVRWTMKQSHLSSIVQAEHFSLFRHNTWMPHETDAKKILTASPWRTGWDHQDVLVLRGWRLSSKSWNPITSPWMKQLTWLRIIHSGDSSLRLALSTSSDACLVRRRRRSWLHCRKHNTAVLCVSFHDCNELYKSPAYTAELISASNSLRYYNWLLILTKCKWYKLHSSTD